MIRNSHRINFYRSVFANDYANIISPEATAIAITEARKWSIDEQIIVDHDHFSNFTPQMYLDILRGSIHSWKYSRVKIKINNSYPFHSSMAAPSFWTLFLFLQLRTQGVMKHISRGGPIITRIKRTKYASSAMVIINIAGKRKRIYRMIKTITIHNHESVVSLNQEDIHIKMC